MRYPPPSHPVAIDGPAGAGKSAKAAGSESVLCEFLKNTLARRIAQKLGFLYIDTGAMYRAVALWAIRLNIPLSENAILLNGEDVTSAIREPGMGEAASKICRAKDRKSLGRNMFQVKMSSFYRSLKLSITSPPSTRSRSRGSLYGENIDNRIGDNSGIPP